MSNEEKWPEDTEWEPWDYYPGRERFRRYRVTSKDGIEGKYKGWIVGSELLTLDSLNALQQENADLKQELGGVELLFETCLKANEQVRQERDRATQENADLKAERDRYREALESLKSWLPPGAKRIVLAALTKDAINPEEAHSPECRQSPDCLVIHCKCKCHEAPEEAEG
jgi:hypothetical protein